MRAESRVRVAVALAAVGAAAVALAWVGGARRATPGAPRADELRLPARPGPLPPAGRARARAAVSAPWRGPGSEAWAAARTGAGASASQRPPPPAAAARDEETARTAPPSPAAPPGHVPEPLVWLEPPAWTPAGLGVVRGLDLLAPRPLVLWRLDPGSGRAAVVARGRSGADGRFRFDDVPLPGRGATLVVAGEDESPLAPTAAEPRALPPRQPAAPVARAGGGADGAWLVVLGAGPPGGAFVLADATGRELARVPLPQDARAARRSRTLDLAAPDPAPLLVAVELADGRRSPWRSVPFVETAPRSTGSDPTLLKEDTP